jgi:hypothetical protein
MVVDTMVPEAFEGTHDYAGIIAVAGFLAAFALSKMAQEHPIARPFFGRDQESRSSAALGRFDTSVRLLLYRVSLHVRLLPNDLRFLVEGSRSDS